MDCPTDADRPWGSVTTTMHPPHEYVAAASELHAVLTDLTHDGLHPRRTNEIGKNLDFGYASQRGAPPGSVCLRCVLPGARW